MKKAFKFGMKKIIGQGRKAGRRHVKKYVSKKSKKWAAKKGREAAMDLMNKYGAKAFTKKHIMNEALMISKSWFGQKKTHKRPQKKQKKSQKGPKYSKKFTWVRNW